MTDNPIQELGYIGDGVYLSFDGYQFWLATDHHENKVVALQPSVMVTLIRTVAKFSSPPYTTAMKDAIG